MSEADIIKAELPEVAAIIRDECCLEGERRGPSIDPADAVVFGVLVFDADQ